MKQIKGDRLYVRLGASQARRRLKGCGCGIRKIESAGRGRAVVIHTATGEHLRELRAVLEDVIEPYMIQQGLLQRTQRGRMLTLQGWRYLGLEAPRGAADQLELIAAEPDMQEAGNG